MHPDACAKSNPRLDAAHTLPAEVVSRVLRPALIKLVQRRAGSKDHKQLTDAIPEIPESVCERFVVHAKAVAAQMQALDARRAALERPSPTVHTQASLLPAQPVSQHESNAVTTGVGSQSDFASPCAPSAMQDVETFLNSMKAVIPPAVFTEELAKSPTSTHSADRNAPSHGGHAHAHAAQAEMPHPAQSVVGRRPPDTITATPAEPRRDPSASPMDIDSTPHTPHVSNTMLPERSEAVPAALSTDLGFVKVASPTPGIIEVAFEVSQSTFDAVQRWLARASSFDPSEVHASIRLLCLPTVQAIAFCESLPEGAPVDDITHGPQAISIAWPPLATLWIELNAGTPTKHAWGPHTLPSTAHPLDLSAHVQSGTNALRFICLEDLAKYVFVVLIGAPAQEEWRAACDEAERKRRNEIGVRRLMEMLNGTRADTTPGSAGDVNPQEGLTNGEGTSSA